MSKLKRYTKIALISIGASLPVQCGKDEFIKFTKEIPCVQQTQAKIGSYLAEGLEIVKDINSRGGITYCFSDSSLAVLKQRMLNAKLRTNYTLPVDAALKPYIPSTGQFGSLRPQNRPHLGIDIYPRLYGRKPKEPVAVLSVSDGIVVSVKKSPQKDPKNLIANNIKIMSPDGKIYSYDHLGRPEDYKGAKYTELKNLGETVHAGDTLGTVGKTGETDVWHLHFGVYDLDAKEVQLKNPVWQKLYKNNNVYAVPMGQIDPLDSKKSGEISKILNQYRIDKGPKVDYLDKL